MKMVYSAKYSDILRYADPDDEDEQVENHGRSRAVVPGKILAAFLFSGWLIVIIVFVLFPLLPTIQEAKFSIQRINPEEIGKSVTTQLFLKIAPPQYDVSDTYVGDDGSTVRTIEYVNPDEVTLAELEKQETRIEISSAGISGLVVDGYSQADMLRGFWHYPDSSVPGNKGNTVIFGHRFYHLPPRTDTFFRLDAVKIGDSVLITTKDTEWNYTVVETKVVEKTDASILANTGDYRLTLVTCTPLWTADKRLVVVAIQDKASSII